MNRNRQSGVTLVELMIVLTIIGIIMGIAYPSYQDQTRKARRTDAISRLQDYQLVQERWRANDTDYGTIAELGVDAADDYYDYTITNRTASTYNIVATAKSTAAQKTDTGCTILTVNQSNERTPANCF